MNKKQLQLVSHEQAVRLKKLGFNLTCTHKYDVLRNIMDSVEHHGEYVLNSQLDDDTRLFLASEHADPTIDTFENNEVIAAPTVALALKWIRDEKGIENSVTFYDVTNRQYTGRYQPPKIIKIGNRVLEPRKTYHSGDYTNYEAAESALLDELLKILEKENAL
ncbi:MAG: hypothetical protein LBS69_12225 [Prevotellaceae bacterium]|jgi:hypothetical protein|nr:hypothetical protein [Prevotellaceae bacterium]